MFLSNMEPHIYWIFKKSWTVGACNPPPMVRLHMFHFLCIIIKTLGTSASKSPVDEFVASEMVEK